MIFLSLIFSLLSVTFSQLNASSSFTSIRPKEFKIGESGYFLKWPEKFYLERNASNAKDDVSAVNLIKNAKKDNELCIAICQSSEAITEPIKATPFQAHKTLVKKIRIEKNPDDVRQDFLKKLSITHLNPIKDSVNTASKNPELLFQHCAQLELQPTDLATQSCNNFAEKFQANLFSLVRHYQLPSISKNRSTIGESVATLACIQAYDNPEDSAFAPEKFEKSKETFKKIEETARFKKRAWLSLPVLMAFGFLANRYSFQYPVSASTVILSCLGASLVAPFLAQSEYQTEYTYKNWKEILKTVGQKEIVEKKDTEN